MLRIPFGKNVKGIHFGENVLKVPTKGTGGKGIPFGKNVKEIPFGKNVRDSLWKKC